MSGRILIVESIATNRIMLTSSLEAAHYAVAACSTVPEAEQLLLHFKPDVIFLDLSANVDAGLAFMRTLAGALGTPAVVATLAFDDSDFRIAALEAGAADVVAKPLSDNVMQARIRSIIRSRDLFSELRPSAAAAMPEYGFAEPAANFRRPERIVVLSSRPQSLMPALAGLVAKYPNRFEVHHSTVDFAGANAQPSPDLFIVDGIGPTGEPKVAGEVLRLQSDLRSRSAFRYASQLLILPSDAADLAAMALDMGADDLVSNRVTRAELSHRIDVLLRRKSQNDTLRANIQSGLEAAVTDPLTGLHNRRYALPHLAHLAEKSAAEGRDFATMILDIDHFKRINDTFGHAAGDAVLVGVAKRLRGKLRPTDMIARIGGEEFLVAMPNTSLEQARQMAERLRLAIENQTFDGAGQGRKPVLQDARNIHVTMSIGVAMGGADCRSAEGIDALFDRADAALYQAKSDGRNMVTLSPTAA